MRKKQVQIFFKYAFSKLAYTWWEPYMNYNDKEIIVAYYSCVKGIKLNATKKIPFWILFWFLWEWRRNNFGQWTEKQRAVYCLVWKWRLQKNSRWIHEAIRSDKEGVASPLTRGKPFSFTGLFFLVISHSIPKPPVEETRMKILLFILSNCFQNSAI